MKTKIFSVFLVLAGLTLAGGDAVYGAQGDILFERKGGAPGTESILPAVFPHWVHRVRYRCYACHPALFEMQQGANTVTMDSIKQGQFCGACHNGNAAFSVEFQSCARCHKVPEE